jgi:outer membrane protein assembly factor BamB
VLDAAGQIPPGVARGAQAAAFRFPNRIVPDGAGGWFVAVNSYPTDRIARLDADLRLQAGWPMLADGLIQDLARSGDTLFVAGDFTSIAGQPRAGLAAIDAASGALRPWTAATPGSYGRIAVSDARVYAARASGSGQPIAAFDRATGASHSWSPALRSGPVQRLLVDDGVLFVAGGVVNDGPDGLPFTDDDADGLLLLDAESGAARGPTVRTDAPPSRVSVVNDVVVTADTIFLAGTFGTLNGEPRAGLAAIDRATGAVRPWRADLEYPAYNGPGTIPVGEALALDGDTLYVGGSFERAGGAFRRNLAALDASTGALLPWRGSVNNFVYRLAAAGGRLAVGGSFTLAGGTPSVDVAALDLASGAPRPWEVQLTSGASETSPDFGPNGFYSLTAAPIDDMVLFPVQSATSAIRAVRADDAAPLAWRIPADLTSIARAGGGLVLVSRRTSATTIAIAAYEPLASTPRWERTLPGERLGLGALLVAGDAAYGAVERFDSPSGPSEGRLFALSLADGAVRWELPVGGSGGALALSSGRLYVGGLFEQVGATPARNLAVLDAASGAVLPWPAALAPNSEVSGMAFDGDRLYLTGRFGAIGAAARPGLAAIDTAGSPALASWTPELPPNSAPTDAIAVTEGALFVGANVPIGTQRGMYGLLIFPFAPAATTPTPSPTTPAPTPSVPGGERLHLPLLRHAP